MSLFRTTGHKDVLFVTCTVSQWVDVFTRPVYADLIIEAIEHYIKHKGLCVYGWVILSNRVQLICSARKGYDIEDMLAGFRKLTSDRIITAIENNEGEQRRTWLLWLLKQVGGTVSLWQPGSDAEDISSPGDCSGRLGLMHLSPVKAGWVDKAADYRYSSARDFEGGKGLIELTPYK